MNCSEMIEILTIRWQLQQVRNVTRGLNPKKMIKGQLGDDGFHTDYASDAGSASQARILSRISSLSMPQIGF